MLHVFPLGFVACLCLHRARQAHELGQAAAWLRAGLCLQDSGRCLDLHLGNYSN